MSGKGFPYNRSMRVIVVGQGGREHALVWKLKASPLLSQIWLTGTNPGAQELAELFAWNGEPAHLLEFTRRVAADLVIVGPEVPLVAGLSDALAEAGIKCFGPQKAAARLEGSKAFAKQIMERARVPTARYQSFKELEPALNYLKEQPLPVVVKDSGLAAGKGVQIAPDLAQAGSAVRAILAKPGAEVVIEEFLEGSEVSLLALVDGQRVLPLLPAQDHKQLLEQDQGPMTGGMGAYCPYPLSQSQILNLSRLTIEPVVKELAQMGINYQGVLYAGLMLTASGPKVLEYNVRFGDPETQAILPLLKNDLLELILATVNGELDQTSLAWQPGAAAGVVMSAPGYPDTPVKGIPIRIPELPPEVLVFHSGTSLENGRLVSNGGRVLTVVGLGRNLPEALQKAYKAVAQIDFPGAHYRRDIGWRSAGRG